MSPMILDPRGQAKSRTGTLAPRTRGLEGATVGLLNSTKRNSDLLLAALGRELMARYGVKELIEVAKPTFSLPVPPNQLADLAARCHFIITGVGD